jgi:peptide/nickel transport system substrate-binding protein
VASFASASPAAQGEKCIRFALGESLGEERGTYPLVSQMGQFGLYDRLMDQDQNLNPIPELATSWKSNKSATVWTFNLRKGVKFHDGKEFTSADVVWTFRQAINPKINSGGVQSTLSFLNAKGIVPVGKYAVQFRLKKPVAELPALITIRQAYIVENGATEASMKHKDQGTGAFMVTNYDGTRQPWRFERNPNYWKKGEPKAACVEYRIIPEPGATTAGLRSGQLDFVQSISYASLPELQGDKNVKLVASAPGLATEIVMWTDTAPFNDPRVRAAMKKVVDRDAMVKTVFRGFATPGIDNPIPPTSPYSWTKTAPKPDIAGAVKLLAAAGYTSSNPLKVDLYTADAVPNMINWAQAFAAMAAKAGIQVNVITTPANDYWDKVWRHQTLTTSAWNPRLPGEAYPLELFDSRKVDPVGNETHWYHPEWEKLVTQALATPDPVKRTALYRQAGKMISQQGGIIVSAFAKTVAGMRANCSGYMPHAYWARVDTRNAYCK